MATAKRVSAEPGVEASGDNADARGHSHVGSKDRGWGLMMLSFSALGIIYGDIGTSPLYAFQAVFTGPPQQGDVLGAASLFFWTLTLIVLVKYVGFIIRFDDNGEGGTFALYSLMCRAAGFTPYGAAQPEELQLAGLSGGLWNKLPPSVARGRWWSVSNRNGSWLKRAYQKSRAMQVALLFVVMMATAMVVGDGVLTPSISVLSAISGLNVAAPNMAQGEIVGVTIIVLVLLFSVQYLGTAKISVAFAPIVCTWLLFNAAVGLANLSMFGWGAWQAVSPHHAILAFCGPGGFEAGWRMLAGIMLAITGAEAMYADLGHFNSKAVMLSFCGLAYPCLVVTYMGQATYLLAHPDAYTDPFWKSLPSRAFWPMLIVATAATVVASQALISGVFSIMRQAMNLGVLPPMRITHTDSMSEGQIYIRSINFMLMLGCVAMVAGFQDTTALGHAYGVAVMSVMFITTILAGIVMLVCYSINPLLVAIFLLFFVPLEGLFLSSNIIKIPEGGWVTIAIAVVVASVNLIWWYGTSAKGKWYKAQAARNTGLLAQLPQEGDTDASQPLITATTGAATTRDASGLHERHTAGKNINGNGLGSVSTPAARGATGAAGASAAARAQGELVSQSWGTGRTLGKAGSSGGAVFQGQPLTRLPGLGIIYTQATSGLPAVLQHLLVNMPVLHEVTVLLTVRVITRPYATKQERFLIRRSSTSVSGFYRVIARYGYMEQVNHGPGFVRELISCLVRFAAQEPSEADPLNRPPQPRQAAVTGVERVLHGEAVAIELPPVAEGRVASAAEGPAAVAAGAADGGAERPLSRWSRVPVSQAEVQVVEDAATTGPDLAVRRFMATSKLSPQGSLDLLPIVEPGQAEAPVLLGRESVNRQQYSLQRGSARRAASAGLATHSAGTSSSVGGGVADGGAAGKDAAVGTSSAQLAEVEALLHCLRLRTVYIMGRSQLVAAMSNGNGNNSNGQEGGGPRCCSVASAGLYCKGLVLGAYRVLANNTHPSSQTWNLPDDALMTVSMVVRI